MADDARTISRIMHEAAEGAIGTLGLGGAPYVSLVTVAAGQDGAPLLLISRLALHTRNLEADPRISLLLRDRWEGETLQGARISLTGRAEPTNDPADRRRFLERHPSASTFADFTDFGFYRIVPENAHLIAGFGRIMDVAAPAFLTGWAGAEILRAGESMALECLNGPLRHRLADWTAPRHSLADTDRIIALDPHGLNIRSDGGNVTRLLFPEPITDLEALERLFDAP